jgi:hypothetical protein
MEQTPTCDDLSTQPRISSKMLQTIRREQESKMESSMIFTLHESDPSLPDSPKKDMLLGERKQNDDLGVIVNFDISPTKTAGSSQTSTTETILTESDHGGGKLLETSGDNDDESSFFDSDAENDELSHMEEDVTIDEEMKLRKKVLPEVNDKKIQDKVSKTLSRVMNQCSGNGKSVVDTAKIRMKLNNMHLPTPSAKKQKTDTNSRKVKSTPNAKALKNTSSQMEEDKDEYVSPPIPAPVANCVCSLHNQSIFDLNTMERANVKFYASDNNWLYGERCSGTCGKSFWDIGNGIGKNKIDNIFFCTLGFNAAKCETEGVCHIAYCAPCYGNATEGKRRVRNQ